MTRADVVAANTNAIYAASSLCEELDRVRKICGNAMAATRTP